MATNRYRVIYHSEIAGKFDSHFGTRVALVSAADASGSDGASRPSPTNIATALQNNSLHNQKAAAVTVLDNVANLDPAAALTNS
jgi:hypothetical protein